MDHFLSTYRQLNYNNLELLQSVYSEDVVFTDPVHKIEGLPELVKYFAELYKGLNSINFEFGNVLSNKEQSHVEWEMTFTHNRLKNNSPITVPGISCLEFNSDNLVCFHRDFFDMGAMLYEHIPFLGRWIVALKRRLAQ